MPLIIQGLEVETADLKHLAKLTGATAIESITSNAFRLVGANANPKVAPFCEQNQLDHALVTAGRKFADFGLVGMDMDSTLITIESIDEIADFIGLKTQVAEITKAGMRGEIDFKESLRQRV